MTGAETQRTTTTVFVGPSLPEAEVRALLPHARIRPPVKHGDLLRLAPEPGDRVLIIDGLFLQTASVRHREILALLGRGVTVAGAASMGALRAAELWRYGMRGYGEVFRLYRDGEIDGDDEVAVVHGLAEDGHRAYCDPLVAIRVALRRAREAGVLNAAEAELMLEAAARLPFRARSFRALDRTTPAGPAAAARFQSWRATHDTDVKAADARLLLRAEGDGELRAAGVGDEPIRNVHTWIFDMWEHQFHGGAEGGDGTDGGGADGGDGTDGGGASGGDSGGASGGGFVADADAAAALRLFHPAFRERHRRHVLSWVAGLAPDHPAVVERAVAAARERGLEAGAPGGWLTEEDRLLPEDEQLARLLVRSFGCARRWSPTRWDLPPDLRTDAALDAGRAVVRAARSHQASSTRSAEHAAARGHQASSTAEAGETDRQLAAWWRCPPEELQAQAWDRGIPDLATLRRIAAPFAGYLRAPDTTTAINAVMSVV